ncbi:MAG TPA: dTMP kinase [Polyangiaceae bacterium LLY-WYZ-15_(1-7)]|nr:dTMP kinase [Sandaracinus sp.]HJK92586.1 dTMP kinase [Polyangiaceae bacterium LLY-WYZ-15_(1-7)]HJL05161.1 dTMP kinase [Polyangiaceae bacterium LLY-WYZ-15_(1-7)]HJL13012.1 dTMP kinase [Polyangiaceae bacterium LLY-WYZ-15_(1-7)]HJL22852.1 dTMP kinase [Polyangiaceae bacterium LLY-WYZ-15_(1-7)]
MIEGLFIALEGVDGAGTTTQTKRLAEGLRARGLPVHATREPSDGPIGMLLRQILTNRVVVPGIRGPRPPSWTTMALLFAADRLDHVEAEIQPNLLDGVTVLSDRYDHSSVAYQSITGGGEAETLAWVKQLNVHARRPDLTLVLDISPEEARRRRVERGRGREIYDDQELQEQLAAFYGDIEKHFPDDRIVHVDGEQSVEAVAKDVMREVRILRGEDPDG